MREDEGMDSSIEGRLLVASPHLLDPNFYRTVVYIAEHGEEGALGLVLNRPSEEPVHDHLPDWAAVASTPTVVFVGGPVSNEIAVGLARAPERPPESWQPAFDGSGLVDLAAGPDAIGEVDALRIFSGYSGWVTGQLEMEMATDSWFLLPALPSDLFTEHPETLWRNVLGRQPGRLAFFATFPHDLGAN
jgi:putative transcriptional regulator